MQGSPEQVVEIFKSAGFQNVLIKEDEDEEEEKEEGLDGEEGELVSTFVFNHILIWFQITCEACKVQSFEDDLVMCDDCEKAYHPDCLPNPADADSEYFICDECKKNPNNADVDVDEGPVRKKQKVA